MAGPMTENLIDLHSVAPNIGDWSTKVQVVTKMNPRLGNNNRTTYQKVLLCDAKGDCAEAVVYNSGVELFEHSLKVGRTYIISNAVVGLVNEKFKNQLTNCKYQLTISARTSVLDVNNDGTVYTPPCPTLLDRTQFLKEIGRGTKISAVCVIIAKRLPRRMFLKERENLLYEYAAVDQNFKPFVVSIWQDTVPTQVLDVLNSTPKLPVFVLMNFTVTVFYGVCLSSTSQSVLHHDYDISAFHDMIKWRDANNDAIMALIKQGGLFEEKLVEESIELLNIKQVLDINKDGKYNILVKAKITNNKQKFYYMCCEMCNYGTTGAYNSNFTCRSCAVTSVAKPRFRCSIQVYDNTGHLDVVLFGNDVEQILALSVTDVYESYCEGKEIPIEVVNARMDSLWFRMKIRGHPSQIKAKEELSYNVVYIKSYEGEYEKCKELATANDPESTVYDVAKKETDVADGTGPSLTLESPPELPDPSNMQNIIPVNNEAKSNPDEHKKRRRLLRRGKRVVMSDDDNEEVGSEITVDKYNTVNSAQSSEPTLAATPNDKKDDAANKTSTMEQGEVNHKGIKGKFPKKVKLDKGSIPAEEVEGKKHMESDKSDTSDAKIIVKRSTRGRIIKPKNYD